MRTIYLHIGPRKTGTTTIQRTLLHNQDYLWQDNTLVPSVGRVSALSAAQHNLAWELLNYGTFRKSYGDWSDLIDCLKNTNHEKIILTSELFSDLPIEKILKIKEYFKDCKIYIIVYLRRQDQLFQSMWAQEVKTGDSDKVNLDFYDWLDNNHSFIIQHGLDYEKLLFTWSSVFGKDHIFVRVLEKNQLEGPLFYDFLQTCGIKNPQKYEITTNQNISPSGKTISLISELRKRLEGKLSTNARIDLYNLLETFGNQEGWNENGINLIDIKIYKMIMNRFHKSNKKIAQEYFGREELFLEPFCEKEISYFSTNNFRLEEILDAFAYIAEKIFSRYDASLKREQEVYNNYCALRNQIDLIYTSRGWILLEKIRKIRKRIKDIF